MSSGEKYSPLELLLNWISKEPSSELEVSRTKEKNGSNVALLHDSIPRVLRFITTCEPFRIQGSFQPRSYNAFGSNPIDLSTSPNQKDIGRHEKLLKKWVTELLALARSEEISERVTCTYLLPCTIDQLDDPNILPLFLEIFSILLHKTENADIRIRAGHGFAHWLQRFEASKSGSAHSLLKKGLDGTSATHQLTFTRSLNAVMELLKEQTTCSGAKRALSVIKAIMDASPSSCRSLVGQIEFNAIKWLDSEITMEEAAACLAAIPACFTSSTSVEWENLIVKLILSGNDLLNQLEFGISKTYALDKVEGHPNNLFPYENLTRYGYDENGNKPKNNKISGNSSHGVVSTRAAIQLNARLAGVSSIIMSALLSSQNRTIARMPLKLLIDFIERMLTMAKPDCNDFVLSTVVTSGLGILECISRLARLHLLRYTSTVVRILIHSLRNESLTGATNKSTRIKLFSTCRVCILCLGTSFANQISKDLVYYAIEEIRTFHQEANVTLSSGSANGGRKRRRINVNETNAAFSRHLKRVEKFEGTDMCIAIIKCLRTLISICGSLMDRKIRIEIDSLVFEGLSPVIKGSSFLLETKAPISRDDDIRLELYKVLLSSILSPIKGCHVSQLLPHAVEIFLQGRKDRNIDISDFCAQAMSATQLIVHPTSPSLYPFLIAQEQHAGQHNHASILSMAQQTHDQMSTKYSVTEMSKSEEMENHKITLSMKYRNKDHCDNPATLVIVPENKVKIDADEKSVENGANIDTELGNRVVSEDPSPKEISKRSPTIEVSSANADALEAISMREQKLSDVNSDTVGAIVDKSEATPESKVSATKPSSFEFIQVPKENDDDSDSDIPDIVF